MPDKISALKNATDKISALKNATRLLSANNSSSFTN
jgi:hypothetical protein